MATLLLSKQETVNRGGTKSRLISPSSNSIGRLEPVRMLLLSPQKEATECQTRKHPIKISVYITHADPININTTEYNSDFYEYFCDYRIFTITYKFDRRSLLGGPDKPCTDFGQIYAHDAIDFAALAPLTLSSFQQSLAFLDQAFYGFVGPVHFSLVFVDVLAKIRAVQQAVCEFKRLEPHCGRKNSLYVPSSRLWTIKLADGQDKQRPNTLHHHAKAVVRMRVRSGVTSPVTHPTANHDQCGREKRVFSFLFCFLFCEKKSLCSRTVVG